MKVPNNSQNTSKILLPIMVAFIGIIVVIFFIRLFIHLVLKILSRFYLKNKIKYKKGKQPKSNIITYKKETEELLRDKKLEKIQNETLMVSGIDEINKDFEKKFDSVNKGKIVGVVKPVGFWTSLILGDELSKLLGKAHALNERSGKGFWVSMLETQSRSRTLSQER